jgi:uncharacterized protein YqjF (DUF2071 family)
VSDFRVAEPVRRAVMGMRWADVTFLHWRYGAREVQRLLPVGLEVETFDGSAWVGLVPFAMTVRPARGPAVPWASFFPETNVRTYVRGPDGRTGIWFLSLDAARLGAVLVARARYGLPYRWARMRVQRDGSGEGATLRYRSARRTRVSGRAVSAVDVSVGAPIARADVTNLEEFLTARFRLYSRVRGNVLAALAEHAPWPLYRADPTLVRDRLIESAGLPPGAGEPLALYSPGVEVRVGRAGRALR